jgi:molecular chaperone HscA
MFLQIHEPGKTPGPHETPKGVAIGIDLGTTNSVVAIVKDRKVEILKTLEGSSLIPSAVAYKDSEILVGQPALDLLETHPETVVCSVKRLIGKGYADIDPDFQGLHFLPSTDNTDAVRFQIGTYLLNPVLVSADILRSLKLHAENALKTSVSQAVITVPAYFSEAARTATRQAATAAGFEVLRLLNEPTAAALAYGLDQKEEGLYVVYDLGGGTFDVSILKMEKGIFQVLATGGDTSLGGDDFDKKIVQLLCKDHHFSEQDLTPSEVKSLLIMARTIKEHLSIHEQMTWPLTLKGKTINHIFTRDQLTSLFSPLIKKSLSICASVLEDADLTPKDIQEILMVGGSTRVPAVFKAVQSFFQKLPLCSLNPDEVVAIGAAHQAYALTEGSDHLLLDVTPLSLGVETMGGLVEKIIPRNTPIPTAISQEFTTYKDGQTAMSIHVLQGERELVSECRSLGRFTLKNIPPLPAGVARIVITYTVDADGLLTVSAQEKHTSVFQSIEIKPSYGLTEEEMLGLLREGFMNTEEDTHIRLLQESIIELERLIYAIQQALKEDGSLLNAQELSEIEESLKQAQDAIQSKNRDAIKSSYQILEDKTHAFAERRLNKTIQSTLKGKKVTFLDPT